MSMRIRPRRRIPRLSAALVFCLALAFGAGASPHVVRAAPLYPLYYSLEIPPLLTGYQMDDQQNKHLLYTGLIRGTLGGLAIDSAAVTLHPGASAGAGGGEFTLRTAAGAVENGLILMTTDRRQTTLLFSGMYLGVRLEFHMVGPTKGFGSVTIATKGLADTSFVAHSEYVAAVTQAVANLAPAIRAQTITEADGNLRLVTAYQTTPGVP
ncbi:MAG TPA: hypothetical protein VGX75_12265 [bacterium]|nr:hypothetical protein [bacterium]